VNYSDKSFVISTHVFATGPAQDLKEYLLKHEAKKILFIGHPLFHDKRLKGSGYEVYEGGEKKEEYYTKLPSRKVNLVDYLLHTMRSIIWVLKSGGVYDLYIGSDNVNATAGVILKKLGKVKKTVYYVIDYNPHRFKNKLMNSIYHWADRFCVRNSDETWNLSPRMIEARKDYFGFEGGNQKVVPIGVWVDRIKLPDPSEVEKHTAVFMGHIIKKQGIQHVIRAIPEIIETIPDFKLVIIGDGEYLDELKRIANTIGVNDRVDFTGYIEDGAQVERLISKCSVALAPYDKYDDNGNLTFTYYADPAKIKVYLACGLCVITNRFVTEMEQYKNQKFLVGIDKFDNVATHVIKLMGESDSKLKEAAIQFSLNYEWGTIFDLALSHLIKNI